MFICISLFTIVLPLKLDKITSVPWTLAFVPVWVACLICLSFLFLYDVIYAHARRGKDLHNIATAISKYIHQLANKERTAISSLHQHVTGPTFLLLIFDSIKARLITWLFALLITIWCFILPLYLDDFVPISLHQILTIPVICFLGLFLVSIPAWVVLVSRGDDSSKKKTLLMFLFFLIGVLASPFVAMTYYKVDATPATVDPGEEQPPPRSWFAVMLPLFCLEGLLALIGLVFSCACASGLSFFGRAMPGCAWWTFFSLPLLACFQVILALNMEEYFSVSYFGVFAPLYLLEVGWLAWLWWFYRVKPRPQLPSPV
jgi:hypothetical protein